MVQIHVVEFGELCRKGCAHLEAETEGHLVPAPTQLNEARTQSLSLLSPPPLHPQLCMSIISLSLSLKRRDPRWSTHCHVLGVALQSIQGQGGWIPGLPVSLSMQEKLESTTILCAALGNSQVFVTLLGSPSS